MMRLEIKIIKKVIILYGLLLIFPAYFVGCDNVPESSNAPVASSRSESASGSSILGVRKYMQNAEKYPGTIEVEGVVSLKRPSKNLVAVIDIEEYKECKVVTCAKLRLPVFWEGEMPEVYDVVRVKGVMDKRNGDRVFITKELKTVGRVDAKK